MNRARRRWILAVAPAVFLGVFFIYPVGRIITTGLVQDGAPTLESFARLVGDPGIRRAAWFTVWQACASTALTLLAGLPVAYVFARYEFWGKRLLSAAITVPFVLPTVVVGASFLAFLSPGGPLGIDLRRSVWAILIAHVFYNVAVVVRTVGSTWSRLDPRLEAAARVLGADRFTAFRRVTLPLLAPSVLAAASLVFLFTFTSFGVVLILGGLEYSTIEVAIWRTTTQRLDLALASALAVTQLVGVALVLWLFARAQRRRSVPLPLVAESEVAHRVDSWRARVAVGAAILALAALLAAPLAGLVARSFTLGGSPSLGNYSALLDPGNRGLFVPPAETIVNSLVFALPATIIAVVIGTLAAAFIVRGQSRAAGTFDVVLMLPLGTSAVTIGFGFLVALDWPVDLRASPVIVPIAHALVAIPIVTRVTIPAMRSVRARLREAAAVLGAPPRRVWRVIDLPIITRAALVGAGFAFAVSLGEFGASAFIVRPDRPTLPTAIFRLLGFPGEATFGQAMALATVLMLLTATAIAAIDRFRLPGQGEF